MLHSVDPDGRLTRHVALAENPGMQASLYQQPTLGLVAFSVSFLSQWLGHGIYTAFLVVFGDCHDLASLLTGLGGMVRLYLLAAVETAPGWRCVPVRHSRGGGGLGTCGNAARQPAATTQGPWPPEPRG